MDGLGLRERKKIRTRASLVEAAAELCLQQGYDNTTVEQIAAAADVSPRTFSRYFPTKDAVVGAVNDDLDQLVAEAMERQPADITEYEALLGASLEVFGAGGDEETPGFRRMSVLIQIINGSSSFRTSALALRHDVTNRATMSVMARRLGVSVDDRAIALITDTWAILFSDSFAGLGQPGGDPIEPEVICDRLSATVELFRRTWQPSDAWPHIDRQPPASAPNG